MAPTRAFHLLIVDDDPLIHQSLKLILPKQWKAYSATSQDEVDTGRFYHAAFVDMHLTKQTKIAQGLAVVEMLTQLNQQIEIVAMSGDLSRDLMENCLKKGAQRFLSKPLMQDEVLLLIDKIEALNDLRNFSTSHTKTQWIGQGTVSQNIRKKLASLKGEWAPVLIEAETGSGKEVVAKILHEQESARPFVSVNVAGISDQLFESEMFGHLKGSFTGADQNKIGLIEAAHGGDLFLDEVEVLPLHHQAKLLRFLESGEIKKVGAKETQKINVRVIVASNRPLQSMVKSGEFREDLYFRLSAHKISIPALRDRLDEIPELVNFFLDKERPKRNKKFTDDGLSALKKYNWPGNVRELKRVCEQLSLVSPLPIIRDVDVLNLIQPQATLKTSIELTELKKGLNALLESYEKNVIQMALTETKGDIDAAAELLLLGRSTIYKKIKDLKIEGVN